LSNFLQQQLLYPKLAFLTNHHEKPITQNSG